MGLDLVEFTFALEDTFGIPLPDADASRLATPGSVVDYFAARLPKGTESVCLEQRAFHGLRAAAQTVTGCRREAVMPTRAWTDLFGGRPAKRAWDQLHHTLGTFKWPRPQLWSLPSTATVGGTARFLAATCAHWLKGSDSGWTRLEIERVVAGLMAEELGVVKFSWHDQFVKDLGCD